MTRRALLIGIGRYASQDIPDLGAPERDIQMLSPILAAPEIGAFSIEPAAIDLSDYELKDRVQNFFRSAKRTDELLIYLSCHGLLESGRFLYFASRNTNPLQVAHTAMSANFLCDEIAASPSPKIMALIDCCFSGRIEQFIDAQNQLAKRLDLTVSDRRRGLLVLTSSGQYQVAVDDDELSRFARVIIEGMRTGDADLDCDGYVRGMDLHGYVDRRFRELGYDQHPRLVFDLPAREFYVSKSPKQPLKIDEARYLNEVFEPFSKGHGRLTKDLVNRYQLRDPSDPVKSVDDLKLTLDHWSRLRHSVAYGSCIRQLEDEHRREYQSAFEEAARGNTEALPEAIRLASRSSDALAEQLEELAGELRVVPAATIDDLTEQGHETSVIWETMRTCGMEVAVTDLLSTGPPVPAFGEILDLMRHLRCRQLANLLRPEDPRWITGVSLFDDRSTAGNILSEAVREAFASDQAQTPGDPAAHEVFALLCCLDEKELRTLLACQVAAYLRVLRGHRSSPAELLAEVGDLGLGAFDARQIVFAVWSDERQPSAEAERLISLAEQGRVAIAYRSLGRETVANMPPDAAEFTKKIRGWYERGDRLAEAARNALEAGRRDEAWHLLHQALRLIPDRADIRELLSRCPPEPVRGVRAEIADDTVVIAWPPSASPAAGIEYLVKRAEAASRPAPGSGRPLSRHSGVTFDDKRPPFNRPLWYAVVPERGGISPGSVSWIGPRYVRPEVRDLELTGQDCRVLVRWQAPDQAAQVRIERRIHRGDAKPGPERPGVGPESDEPIVKLLDARPGEITQYIDDQVANDTVYQYRITVIYRDSADARVTTTGIPRKATPAKPPDSVPLSSVQMMSALPPRVVLEVPRPKAGTVQVYAMAERHPPFGAVVSRSNLHSLGFQLHTTPYALLEKDKSIQRIEVELPAREIWLTAVTVNGDWAAIGGSEQCRQVPPIDSDSVSWKREGDELRLSFPWPNELHEIEAHCEQQGIPPKDIVTTRTGYHTRGLRIPLSGEAATVLLYPVVLLPSRRLRGPHISIEIPARPVVEYHLKWKRQNFPARPRILAGINLTARQEVQLTRLVLVSAEGSWQPLRMTDGTIIQEHPNLQLHPDRQYWIPVDLPFTAPCWATCFTPDDDIDLRHPPPSERRLRLSLALLNSFVRTALNRCCARM